ncbi:MAG: D-tyrosyl-tRNA(Tyr) deacylase [Deltaproteobacteria bacterium]|nr:D-tyrosyl-tRNA(Tyr) deacylase [Deltaproteobacteria bacterium]
MRAVVQRVLSSRVIVAGEEVGAIGRGLLVLVGFAPTDDDDVLAWVAKKCVQLRIFSDAEGKMNRSVIDVRGDLLVVSQFTLYGDVRRGNRPSFGAAAPPDGATKAYQRFCALASAELGKPVQTGRFGADMKVELTNDGPVTLWVERECEAPKAFTSQ